MDPSLRGTVSVMALVTSQAALTLSDLEAMPHDGRRYELVGGAIVITPAPVPGHQLVSARLQRLLEQAVPQDHAVFDAPIDSTCAAASASSPTWWCCPGPASATSD